MFTRQTVFVLGAGCSMPYGFPSGQGLIHEVHRIRFVHIHGSFGDDKFEKQLYDKPTYSHEEYKTISERLKLINEDSAHHPNFAEAITLLHEARCICFLGYGFHDLNNKGLQLLDIGAADPNQRKPWFASRFQLTDVEFDRRIGKLRVQFGGLSGDQRRYVGNEADSALEILRKLPIIR
jgi:hypothetical protein